MSEFRKILDQLSEAKTGSSLYEDMTELESILERLRDLRSKETDTSIRQDLNVSCDRLDVAISKIYQWYKGYK